MKRGAVAMLAVLAVLPGAPAVAKCSPKHVLKIVFSVDGVQQTLYRHGETRGRLENAHVLIVANEPDLWTINQDDKSAHHAVDDGPPVFHALIVDETTSELWSNFEYGCEVPFMEAVGAKPEAVEGSKEKLYEHSAEGVTARLFVSEAGIPQRVEVVRKDDKFTVTYVKFEQLEKDDLSLFDKPAGVTFTDAK